MAELDALKRIALARKALSDSLLAACEAYANGATGQASPIVDDRFKGEGNARFAPLSWAYFREKAAARGGLRTGMRKAGRVVAKDVKVGFQSTTGELTGFGSGQNLPILVRTGLLRERVSRSRRHRIEISPDGLSATIWFVGLPPYAAYHQTGVGRLPKRSPVEPNRADRLKFLAYLRRVLKVKMGLLSRDVTAPQTGPDLGRNNSPRGVGVGST